MLLKSSTNDRGLFSSLHWKVGATLTELNMKSVNFLHVNLKGVIVPVQPYPLCPIFFFLQEQHTSSSADPCLTGTTLT